MKDSVRKIDSLLEANLKVTDNFGPWTGGSNH